MKFFTMCQHIRSLVKIWEQQQALCVTADMRACACLESNVLTEHHAENVSNLLIYNKGATHSVLNTAG